MKFLTVVSFLFVIPIMTLAQAGFLRSEWSFRSLKENGENIILPELSQGYLAFSKNGGFSAAISCNHFKGKYLLGTKGKLRFNSIRTTLMNCSDEESKIENSFGNVLVKITKYQIKEKVLTLQDAKGRNSLTLIKVNLSNPDVP
jgi:heat shock protein HslJ